MILKIFIYRFIRSFLIIVLGLASAGSSTTKEGTTEPITGTQPEITLTEVKEPEPELKQESMTYGDKGRLVIPDVNISVRLYDCTNKDISYSQKISDAYDSAYFYQQTDPEFFWVRAGLMDDSILIGDHDTKNQFHNIYNCKPGDYAYIYHQDGTYDTYLYDYEDDKAYNERRDVSFTLDGLSYYGDYPEVWLSDGSPSRLNYDGITLYTCHGNDSHNVHVVRFKKVT